MRLAELDEKGFGWIRSALQRSEVEALGARLGALEKSLAGAEGRGKAGAGMRIPLGDFPEALQLLQHPALASALPEIFGAPPRLVRAIHFDKSESARWWLRFHRDTMIPVKEHHPSALLTAPSVKAGVPHVRATAEILAGMLAVRIHLDRVTENNGPLRVIPGSHRISRLEDASIPSDPDRLAVTCLAEPGDILLMRPLLIHGSPKPTGAGHRRILHLELAGDFPLPDGFEWHIG